MRAVLTLTVLANLAAAFASAQGSVVSELTSYDGQLDVIRGGIPLAQYPNLPMQSKDLLHARDGRATVKFTDGTELRIGKNTRLEIVEEVTAEGRRRLLDVFFGSTWISLPKGHVMTQVQTGDVHVRIGGTVIEYVSREDGAVFVGVSRGSAAVTARGDGGRSLTLRLLAGQQTAVPPGGAPSLPKSFAPGSLFEGAPSLPAELIPLPADSPTVADAGTPADEAPLDLDTLDLDMGDLDDLGLDDLDDSPSDMADEAPKEQQTQAQYAMQLINDLGVASALPPNATLPDIFDFLTGLNIRPCKAGEVDRSAEAPLLPFASTGDLHVLDSGSGQILRLDNKGKVSIAVERDEIAAATTKSTIGFTNKGIAFDFGGAMYFTEDASHSLLKHDGAALGILVDADKLRTTAGTADPDGIAFAGSRNAYDLFVTSDSVTRPALFKVDRVSGALGRADVGIAGLTGVRSVELSSGLVGHPNGLYALSAADPNAVLSLGLTGGPASAVGAGTPLSRLGRYATRNRAGELILVDADNDSIHIVDRDGAMTELVSTAALEAATEAEVDLGALTFDSTGNLYIVDMVSNSVLVYEPSKDEVSVFTSAKRIEDKTKVAPRLDGGIAFAYKDVGGWVPHATLELEDLLCLGGIDPNDPNAPLVISSDEMIERILRENADLFWLQVRRKQSTSPFAP